MNRISHPPLGAPGCYANPICANSISLLPRFALCEASKWLFYLRYDSGAIYRPSTRDFELAFLEVQAAEATRLQAIWMYWERDDAPPDADEAAEDELHPDHRPPSS